MRKTKTTWIRFGGTLLLILSMTGCGNPFKKQGAPTIKGEAGLNATCTSESQALAIAKKYNVQYRVINKKSKIMEIIGLDKETLRKELPQAKIYQNKIFHKLISSLVVKAESVEIKATTSERDSSHTNDFNHLVQIDGFTLPSNSKGAGAVIAVVDSGVYYNHEHLIENLRVKNSEQNQNGSDSDANGYVDDFRGWDFYNNDNDPEDDNGHGTHVAGLAAGRLSGVAPHAKILPVKVLNSNGSGDIGTVAQGILYAIQNGADVVNLSLGGPAGSELTAELKALLAGVQLAQDRGVMIIAAAGNGGFDSYGDDNDQGCIYPANIQSEAMISVAAVDAVNDLTTYSNYGKNTVHIAAPGGSSWYGGLLSTKIPNCSSSWCNELSNYVRMAGTSMSTPLVAGLVAIIKGRSPNLSIAQIRAKIFNNGDNYNNLGSRTITGKVINVQKTIQSL